MVHDGSCTYKLSRKGSAMLKIYLMSAAVTDSMLCAACLPWPLQANEHCADGFKCVASIAFPEYKACRPIVMN
jgi:hypothetical protein